MLCVQILSEIKQTWSMMSLSYETHTSTGTPLLKANENLIETLEDNQVTSCISLFFLQKSQSIWHKYTFTLFRPVWFCSDQINLVWLWQV